MSSVTLPRLIKGMLNEPLDINLSHLPFARVGIPNL
jgi:hypothetical protein